MMLQAGHRLAILSRHFRVHLAMHGAADREGFCLVPIDPGQSPQAVQQALDDCDVDCVVADRAHAALAEQVRNGRPTLVVEDDGSPALALEGPLSEPTDTDTYCHIQTSGTTGRPKWIAIPRAALMAHRAAAMERLGCDRDSTWLACLPMHHIGGIALVDRCLHGGGRLVSMDRFDADEAVQAIAQHNVTHVSVVPTMLKRMLAHPCPPSLACVLVGGDRLPPDTALQALEAGWPIYASYGLSECCSQVATATPEELRHQPETVGRPLACFELSVEDEEIVVTGPTGTVHTGDLGHIEDGRLFVTGRIDDRIVTGGENVDPAGVEAALQRVEGVEDACAFGIPDEEWGHRVVAMVVGGSDAEAVREAVRAHLPPHAVPKEVRIVDHIPRGRGKSDRRALAATW